MMWYKFCCELMCLMGVRHLPRVSVDWQHTNGHRARVLRLPDYPHGHTVVPSGARALSDLRLTCVTALMAQEQNNCQSFIRHGSGQSLANAIETIGRARTEATAGRLRLKDGERLHPKSWSGTIVGRVSLKE